MGLSENKKQEIYFKNIELMCNIGVYKHEKEKPQRVIVNIKILLCDKVNPKNDKINETLNYNLVYKNSRNYFLISLVSFEKQN